MTRRETYIEQQVCKYATGRGWRQRKMEFVGRRGCPDRWFMRGEAQLIIIEFKDKNGALSPHQRREVNWLLTHGFNVHVIDSIEDGCAVFDAWDQQPEPSAGGAAHGDTERADWSHPTSRASDRKASR
ncbi:hypothetical protein [Shimia sp.]|uniref:hypothetical protein n=1 Tax=Shimia sp. TaxID=1954381 RepID=UPI003298D637